MQIKDLFSDKPSSHKKKFDLFIQVTILVAIVIFTIETLPDLTDAQKSILRIIDYFVVFIFTTEYILRIYYAPSRWKYIFSFYGIVDLLAILPFFLALHVDLRSLRIVRVMTVFRALKLLEYNRALHRLRDAYLDVKEDILMFFLLSFVFIYLAAVGIYYFEHEAQPEIFTSVFDALWWSVATLTAVGYGDVYPITPGGRVFTFVILLIGLAIVAIPSGIIASALTKADK